MPGIKPVVTCHLKIPFWDMLDEELYEIDGRDGLLDKNIIFMPIVMESDIIPVIGVNAGKRNDRAAQVTADILNDGTRIGKRGFCIDIEAILIFVVDKGFCLFEGGADSFFQFIKKYGLESLTQVSIVEMPYRPPGSPVREAALCDEAVDMGIPFQGPAKGMEDADEAGDKVLGLIELIEHMRHDIPDSLEEAVQEGTVFQEEVPEPFVNGKDAVAVVALQELEGHGGGALLAVFDAAGRAEAALAAEGNELHLTTLGAGVHGPAKRRVAAVNHFFDVLHFDVPGVECILDYFVIVFKNVL